MDTMRAEDAIREGETAKAERHIYVIFSSTPFKMGSLIRFFTRTQYNHVSISIDPSQRELYSFARHHRNTPFYGGFVREGGSRFCCGDRRSKMKICALPITEAQYLQARALLEEMNRDAEAYVYNFLSAFLYPLHLRVRLPNAYTCIEFAVDFLLKIGVPPLSEEIHPYSIKELEALLDDYSVYCGESTLESEEDDFDRLPHLFQAFTLTLGSHARLLKSFVKHKIL